MDQQNEQIEKYMNSKVYFWLACFAVIGPISFIFYFPILFILKVVLSPIGIEAQTIVLATWAISGICAFGALKAGWKLFKS